jgi:5'-3' exonuclease
MDEARQISFEQGQRLLTSMQSTFDTSCKCKLRHEAIVCFQKGLKVTRLVEENCIAALKSLDVTVIIAPYSAAAQLAHLCQIGMCHAVISENSSVLAYSAVTGIPMPILYNFENSGMVNQCDIRTLGIVSDSQQQIQSHNALQKLDTNQLQDACQCIGNNDLKELFRHGSNGDNARLFIQFFIIAGYGSFCDAICDISTSELLQVYIHYLCFLPYLLLIV